ncbi:hypothetical protein [Streptomyces sp. AC555_RSS877]|uniref:hypothetical protein n=1 Tax=Streptomyces sp. AC555_RSS877 TaxID=2823688 RepID=UPI001C254F42|nr:hypothetical protein [Streptomyces sp. AC555_RSS877]
MRSREDDLDFRDRAGRRRKWWHPSVLAVLGLSVPVSVVGVALFTADSLSRRMGAHAEAMRELDRIVDARKA